MDDSMTVWHLSPEERERLRLLLLAHFPELGTDEEMTGADVVDVLTEIYADLCPLKTWDGPF